MSFEIWIAFILACLAMSAIPGPGMLNILGYAISSGRKTALMSVAGMAAGDIVAMSLSMAGVGALLAASATAFSVLKIVGAGYLIYLGVITIRNSGKFEAPEIVNDKPIGTKQAVFGGFLISALHPKTIIFSVAFLPQFINPHANYAEQAILVVATFAVIFACVQTVIALAASSAERFLTSRTARLWTGRIGGSAFIACGVATALMRKPS